MPIRIVIADDHAIVREGLWMILESQSDFQVAGEAVTGREALLQAEALQPDVIIMDIAMPELNGIEAVRMISEQVPSTRTIMLSMHHTQEHVFRAVQAGASGYILKESAGSHVVTAIRTVMKGLQYFCEGVEAPPKTRSVPRSPVDRLSPRELEVIQLVAEGKTSVEIAEILSLSPKSIETYRSRLMQKLGINNIPALVKFAILHGITPSE